MKDMMKETVHRILNADPEAFVGEVFSLAMLCAAIVAIFSLPAAT